MNEENAVKQLGSGTTLGMKTLGACIFVVLAGLATFAIVMGVWIALAGIAAFAGMLYFIRTRMTTGIASPKDILAAPRLSALVEGARQAMSVWDGIELGTSYDGTRLVIRLTDGSMLVAGQTRSGKTVFVSNLIAACALDPNVRLAIFDGKRSISYDQYRHIAKVDRSGDPTNLIKFLIEIENECERRYSLLGSMGEEKITQEVYESGKIPLYVIFIDEVARYTVTLPNKKLGQTIVYYLSTIASMGVGCGVILVMANQRVATDIIPGMIRANLGQRVAFRVADHIESDMALGAGSSKRGFDASTISIDPSRRGTGYASVVGTPTVKFRADLIEYKHTLDIAESAGDVRSQFGQFVQPYGDDTTDTIELDLDDEMEDILEEDFLPPSRDLLADLKSVWGRDEDRLHLSTLLKRLQDLAPDCYGDMSQRKFGLRITEIGLGHLRKQFTIDDRVNNWGLEASALYAGPDGKDSKMERAEREAAALDALSITERALYEAKVAEIRSATACSYCHRMFELGETATVDHVVPLNKGGSSRAFNLVACCFGCNSSKRDSDVTEWLTARK